MSKLSEKSVWASDFCVINDTLYMTTHFYSAFIACDLTTGDVRYATEIERVWFDDGTKYCTLIPIHNKIIIIPRYAKKILVFDADSKIVKTGPGFDISVSGGRFLYAYVVDSKIYCVPEKYPKVVVFDIENEIVIDELQIGDGEPDYFGYADVRDNTILIPSIRENCIHELQIEDNRVVTHNPSIRKKWLDLTCWKNNVYLISDDGFLYKCLPDTWDALAIGRCNGRIYSGHDCLWNIDYENNAVYKCYDNGEKVEIEVNGTIINSKMQDEFLYVLMINDGVLFLVKISLTEDTVQNTISFATDTLWKSACREGIPTKENDQFFGVGFGEMISWICSDNN